MAWGFDGKASRERKAAIAKLEVAVKDKLLETRDAEERLRDTLEEAHQVIESLPVSRALGWRRDND